MLYEYKKQQVTESEFDGVASALAADGWRLVDVVVNPLATAEASPLYVSFWEREA